MGTDLQKASFWKRISAGLFDVIVLGATFAAAGVFVGFVGSWTSIRKFMNV